MRARVGAFLFCCLILPIASAAEGEGSFTIQGMVEAAPGTLVEGNPFAFFAGQTDHASAFEVKVAEAKVHAFEQSYQEVGSISFGGDYRAPSWILRDATIRLVEGGDHAGFGGIHPAADAALSVVLSTSGEGAPRAVSSFGNEEATTTDRPGVPDYHQTVSRPHILTVAAGTATYEGRGGMKINGLDVEVAQARGNTTRHETGVKQTGPTERTFTWLYVEFLSPAKVTLSTPEPFTIASPRVLISGAGSLAFTPSEGELRTSEASYLAEGTRATIHGHFRATLDPLAGGRSARLGLSGDVTPSGGFVRQPAPPLLGADAPAWVLALVLSAVVTVSIGTAALVRRRRGPASVRGAMEASRPPAPFRGGDVESLRQAAEEAADDEDWPEAHRLLREARALSPADGTCRLGGRHGAPEAGSVERGPAHLPGKRLPRFGRPCEGCVGLPQRGRLRRARPRPRCSPAAP